MTAEEFTVKVQKYTPAPERKKFMELLQPGGNILDAGCGSGRDTNYFATQGFTVTGIDLSQTLLNYALRHKKKNATFLNMDLRSMSFEDGSFDGIWACASLLHLKRGEIPPVLTKFYQFLPRGGILYLLMKQGSGERMTTRGSTNEDVRFFSYFSIDEIRLLLKEAGFTILDMFTWDQQDRHFERPHEIWISSFARKQ